MYNNKINKTNKQNKQIRMQNNIKIKINNILKKKIRMQININIIIQIKEIIIIIMHYEREEFEKYIVHLQQQQQFKAKNNTPTERLTLLPSVINGGDRNHNQIVNNNSCHYQEQQVRLQQYTNKFFRNCNVFLETMEPVLKAKVDWRKRTFEDQTNKQNVRCLEELSAIMNPKLAEPHKKLSRISKSRALELYSTIVKTKTMEEQCNFLQKKKTPKNRNFSIKKIQLREKSSRQQVKHKDISTTADETRNIRIKLKYLSKTKHKNKKELPTELRPWQTQDLENYSSQFLLV